MATMTGRVRAPELIGAGGWLNAGAPLTLAGLRGRVVILDFWTFCCINCIRVVEELRELEQRFGDRLVVIGVHSPKFPHETDHAAVARAVRRHRIEHPVLDDPELQTWQRYGVRAWPTLVVIDPDGYAVAMASGEGNGPAVGQLVERLLAGAAAPVPAGPAFSPVPPAPEALLSFPGKVAAAPDGRIAVADTGHDRVLVCDRSGRVLDAIDGFSQPQGVRFDGDRLLVCDTVAGRLVAVSLRDGERRVLAEDMRSPWDVVRLADGRLAVAEAGLHRILAVPSNGGAFTVLAGTRAEGLRDGPAEQAHLAQPSGLTVLADGTVVVADSEVSALRTVRDGQVVTLAGRGLFEWGESDGDGAAARLQHPLGVAALPDGGIAVADTFNSRLRVWRDGHLSTPRVAAALDEPGGLDVLPDGRLVVADTNNHRILLVDLAGGLAEELPVGSAQAEPLSGPAGSILRLSATLDLDGEELYLEDGDPLRVIVTADPPGLLAGGPRTSAAAALPVELEVPLGTRGQGTLTVDLVASTCHDDVCTVRRRTLRHPLTVT